MFYSKYDPKEMILRDWLAKDRTILANERTFLAYVRTSLMFAVAGATFLKFLSRTPAVLVMGIGLIVLGVVFGVLGIARFMTMKKNLDHLQVQASPPDRDSAPAE